MRIIPAYFDFIKNYIFLDIDGVLKLYPLDSTNNFNPLCVLILNEILEKLEARIIISSSWRNLYSIEELKKIFRKNGVRGEIVGCTRLSEEAESELEKSEKRTGEINDYILENGIAQWIVIDDTQLYLGDKQVRVNKFRGLERKHIGESIIKMNY